MAFIQRIKDHVSMKVNNCINYCEQCLIHTRDSIVSTIYARPKLYITAKLQAAYLSLLSLWSCLVYTFVTCPKQAIIWFVNGVVLVFYTKPKEVVIKIAEEVQKIISTVISYIILVFYTKPMEFFTYIGMKIKEGVIYICDCIVYTLYTAPKTALTYCALNIRDGCSRMWKLFKYATFTYPKKCIIQAGTNTKQAINKASAWVHNKAHQAKILFYLKPIEVTKKGYERGKSAYIHTKASVIHGASYTKTMLYTRPKLFLIHSFYMTKARLHSAWSWTKSTAIKTKINAIGAKNVTVENLRNFKNLPTHRKILICLVFVLVLLVFLQSIRISIDMYNGRFKEAESKAGLFYAILKVVVTFMNYLVKGLWHFIEIVSQYLYSLMCQVAQYLCREICYMSGKLWIGICHVALWILNGINHVYILMKIVYVFCKEILSAMTFVLEKYNNYRDVLFLGFVGLMSVYCTGLTRDYMADEDEDEAQDGEDLEDSDSEITGPETNTVPETKAQDKDIVHVSAPTSKEIDFEVDFSDSDEDFLPYESDVPTESSDYSLPNDANECDDNTASGVCVISDSIQPSDRDVDDTSLRLHRYDTGDNELSHLSKAEADDFISSDEGEDEVTFYEETTVYTTLPPGWGQ